MDEKRGIEITPEIEEKLIEIGKRAGIDIEQLKKRIELMKQYKRKIYGVWTIPGWMWIATEQDTLIYGKWEIPQRISLTT